MFIPDTNIFIRGFGGFDPEKSFLEKITQNKKLVLSVVVVAEFLAKVNKQDEKKFNLLVGRFGVLKIDLEVANQAAVYRKQLFKRTRRTLLLDCFLAAQAKVHHLTLVTNNKADFPIDDIKVITP